MQCPYCTTEINAVALVCPQCRRDLYLFKPLLEKINTLETALAEAEAEQTSIDELGRRIEELEAALENQAAPVTPASAASQGLRNILLLWLPPLLLLLLAHSLIVIIYDLDTLYLRIVSLLIPLPFGLALMRRGEHHIGLWLGAAFAMAAAAVFGMSWLTGLVDHTPILPAEIREWKEFAEYAASVGFSYITGMILGSILRRSKRKQTIQGGIALRIAQAAGKHKGNVIKAQELATKLNEIGGTLTAVGTTALSIYTGLKSFWGS